MASGTKKSLLPEVRAALIIIFQLGENPPSCPAFLIDVGQMVLPQLQGQVDVSKASSYTNLRYRLRKIPKLIAPYWGTEERESAKWIPEDLEVLQMLKQRGQYHQIVAHLTKFMSKNPRRVIFGRK